MNMPDHAKDFNPSRRNLMKLAPAASLAAIFAGGDAVQAADVSPVEMKFLEWQEAERIANDISNPATDAESTAQCAVAYALADEMLVMQSFGPRDFVLKMLAYTFYGEFDISNTLKGHLLYDEAFGIAGMPERIGLTRDVTEGYADTARAEPLPPSKPTIGALFAEWQETRVEWLNFDEESDEAEAIWSKAMALENQMVATPSRSASDLAQKLFAYCSGEINCGPIKAEIAALAGVV